MSGIHRWQVNSPQKGSWTRFHLMTSSWSCVRKPVKSRHHMPFPIEAFIGGECSDRRPISSNEAYAISYLSEGNNTQNVLPYNDLFYIKINFNNLQIIDFNYNIIMTMSHETKHFHIHLVIKILIIHTNQNHHAHSLYWQKVSNHLYRRTLFCN